VHFTLKKSEKKTLLRTATCEVIAGLVAITQMLNQVSSTEKFVKGSNKIHDGRSMAINLLFSDLFIS